MTHREENKVNSHYAQSLQFKVQQKVKSKKGKGKWQDLVLVTQGGGGESNSTPHYFFTIYSVSKSAAESESEKIKIKQQMFVRSSQPLAPVSSIMSGVFISNFWQLWAVTCNAASTSWKENDLIFTNPKVVTSLTSIEPYHKKYIFDSIQPIQDMAVQHQELILVRWIYSILIVSLCHLWLISRQ